MGRYLDLLNGRRMADGSTISAVPSCDISDQSDGSADQNELRSLMSLLSRSNLKKDAPATQRCELADAEGGGWPAEAWQAYFAERAGMAELTAGVSRAEAEARAFACCVAEWLNRNFERSPPGKCLGCGQSDEPNEPLLPFGTDRVGFVWLHSRCWSAWMVRRNAEAVAALSAMGIGPFPSSGEKMAPRRASVSTSEKRPRTRPAMQRMPVT